MDTNTQRKVTFMHIQDACFWVLMMLGLYDIIIIIIGVWLCAWIFLQYLEPTY